MSYIKAIFVITILDLVLANSSINNWNLKTSAINLLSNTHSNERLIFNATNNGKNIYIKKSVYKNESQIYNETIVKINDGEFTIETTEFENIQTFYYLQNKYYICLKENYMLVSDSDNPGNFTKFIPRTLNTTVERNLKCEYINGDNLIFFALLNSYENNIIHLKYLNGSFIFRVVTVDELYDFFTYSQINSTKFYVNMILLDNKHISLTYIEIDYPNFNPIKTIDLIYNAIFYSHRYLYFYKETNIFYYMLYNTVFDFTSGYSLNEIGKEISSNEDIKIYKNSESPLKIFGESEIYYLKFIRNTRFAYYKIKASNAIIYHGILDIKLNKIIFNTNDYIKEFRPLTNYSMLAITNDSAYEICASIQDGKCIEECEEGQELIINYEKGNYCAKQTSYNSDNFNYPIIIIISLILLTILIVVVYIIRRKKNNNIEMSNYKKMALFDPNAREKD